MKKIKNKIGKNEASISMAAITISILLVLTCMTSLVVADDPEGTRTPHTLVGTAYYGSGGPTASGCEVKAQNTDTGQWKNDNDDTYSNGAFAVQVGSPSPNWDNHSHVTIHIEKKDGETYQGWKGQISCTIYHESGSPQNIGSCILSPPSSPGNPGVSGPSSGFVDTSYSFTATATDPNSIDIKYGWDWNGDGSVDEWSAWVSSGSPDTRSHQWSSANTYNIQVKAKNKGSQESGWGTHSILIDSQPPSKPSTPSGTTNGMHGTSYSYTTSATDPDNDNIKYGWDWNGDSTVDQWTGFQASGTPVSTPHSWSEPGTFNVKVIAEDTGGAQSPWSDPLSVNMGNTAPPIPSTPSGETSGHHGTSYTYSTSAVTDPEGDSVEYMFDWDDGSYSDWSSSTSASHSWTTVNTFSVRVMSRDTWDESGWSSSLSVTMDNRAPNTPSTPSGASSGYQGQSYTYSTSTTDPDGDTLQYFWDWDDGTNSGWISSNSKSNSWGSTGTFEVKVKARDSWDESDWSPVKTVQIDEAPLGAEAGGPYEGNVGIAIQFYGSATGGVTPYSWSWNFGDGHTSSLQNPTHAYEEVGDYAVSLTVTDSASGSAIDYANCDVYTSDTPIAEANGPYEGEVGEEIEFEGDVSGGTAPYEWLWDFGDGNTSDEQDPVHIYLEPGEYIVNLTVIDNNGFSDLDNATVTILEPNAPPEKPETPSGPSSGKAGEQYTYTCTATDPDGDQLHYLFDWGDGSDSGWIGPINSGDIVTASHTWAEKADYEIKVKAKDPRGEESEWSDPLPVSMPKNKAINVFQLFLEKLIGLFPFLEWLLSLPVFDGMIG